MNIESKSCESKMGAAAILEFQFQHCVISQEIYGPKTANINEKTAKQFKIRCFRPSINALKQQKSRRKEKETEGSRGNEKSYGVGSRS
jgi:hypothetical protein